MKRLVAFLLVLVLCSACISAFAAGKLNVVQENYYTISSFSTYGYVFAKVENSGDKPIKVNTGLLEVYNADGDPLSSTDYLSTYLTYLEPGQYTYVSAYTEVKEGAEAVDDYALTVAGKSDNDHKMILLPCETSYEPNVSSGFWSYNYMYVTYTNNTDVPLYDITAVVALLDDDNNILYIDDDSLYSSRALNPGSSITLRLDVRSTFVEYFEAKGLTPTHVDAIVYAEVDE